MTCLVADNADARSAGFLLYSSLRQRRLDRRLQHQVPSLFSSDVCSFRAHFVESVFRFLYESLKYILYFFLNIIDMSTTTGPLMGPIQGLFNRAQREQIRSASWHCTVKYR